MRALQRFAAFLAAKNVFITAPLRHPLRTAGVLFLALLVLGASFYSVNVRGAYWDPLTALATPEHVVIPVPPAPTSSPAAVVVPPARQFTDLAKEANAGAIGQLKEQIAALRAQLDAQRSPAVVAAPQAAPQPAAVQPAPAPASASDQPSAVVTAAPVVGQPPVSVVVNVNNPPPAATPQAPPRAQPVVAGGDDWDNIPTLAAVAAQPVAPGPSPQLAAPVSAQSAPAPRPAVAARAARPRQVVVATRQSLTDGMGVYAGGGMAGSGQGGWHKWTSQDFAAFKTRN